MSDSAKATRATVAIGALEVDGFMLPDCSYRMSQTQAAECVGLTERNAREFLESNAFRRLMGEGYTPAILEIESETQLEQLLLQHGINPITADEDEGDDRHD